MHRFVVTEFSQPIRLQDCLQLFCEPELLGADQTWQVLAVFNSIWWLKAAIGTHETYRVQVADDLSVEIECTIA